MLCLERIAPVCLMLKNHCDNLLAFVSVLEDKFAEIAALLATPRHFADQTQQ